MWKLTLDNANFSVIPFERNSYLRCSLQPFPLIFWAGAFLTPQTNTFWPNVALSGAGRAGQTSVRFGAALGPPAGPWLLTGVFVCLVAGSIFIFLSATALSGRRITEMPGYLGSGAAPIETPPRRRRRAGCVPATISCPLTAQGDRIVLGAAAWESSTVSVSSIWPAESCENKLPICDSISLFTAFNWSPKCCFASPVKASVRRRIRRRVGVNCWSLVPAQPTHRTQVLNALVPWHLGDSIRRQVWPVLPLRWVLRRSTTLVHGTIIDGSWPSQPPPPLPSRRSPLLRTLAAHTAAPRFTECTPAAPFVRSNRTCVWVQRRGLSPLWRHSSRGGSATLAVTGRVRNLEGGLGAVWGQVWTMWKGACGATFVWAAFGTLTTQTITIFRPPTPLVKNSMSIFHYHDNGVGSGG